MRALFLIGLLACTETEGRTPRSPWVQRPDMHEGRRRVEASATGLGSRVIVLGGFHTSDREVPRLEITREMLQFDPLDGDGKWEAFRVEAPEALTHAAFVSVGGSLYILGGLLGDTFVPTGKAWRLSPNKDTWDELAPMPEGFERGAAAVVHSPGHIYLFGGETAAGHTASVLAYVIADNEWQHLPDLPTPRSHAAAMRMAEDGTFIVAGGNSIQGPLGDVWSLQPITPDGTTPMWKPRAPMPTARGGCAYGVLYGQLVCAGGEIGAATTSVVEIYDPTENEWSATHVARFVSQPEMLFPRAGAAGAVVSSRLFVVGGSETSALEPTGTTLEFDLLDTISQ